MQYQNKRTKILEDASRLISGDREAAYGAPAENFERVAAMWMLHWAPQCKDREDWKDALTWIDHEATRLGVGDRL